VSPRRRQTGTPATILAPRDESRTERQLAALAEIGRTMVSHFDYEHALAAVIEKTAQILDSATGAFMLYDEAAGLLCLQKPAFGRFDNEELLRAYRLPLSAGGNAVTVFLTGEPYLTNVFRSDPRMLKRFVGMSVAQRLMTVPLQVEGRSIGVFHIQDKLSGDYTQDDLALLQLMAPTLAVLVMSSRMLRELRDHRRQLEAALDERKLQVAKAARIQRELLPQVTPVLDGYDLAAACLAADDVAGDFYDWMLLPDGRLTVTVADVMGKGISASLVMASLRAALRAAPADLGPATRIGLAEESMALGISSELFVTAFHGDVDLASGTLRYVDAGHGFCVIRRPSGKLTHLPERSLPLGIVPGQEYREGVIHLDAGDTLIVHSDGLVEREGRTGDLGEFWDDLREAVSANDMVRRLLARMPVHLSDDVTILVLRRVAPEAPSTGES
jgi:serine phosphatase RsbU (regulator of sigma subunit)